MPDHSTYTGANLHRPFHYEQATDPGAVPVGSWWADTTTRRIRRLTSTGWTTYGGTGGGGLSGFTQVPDGTTWAEFVDIITAANDGDTIILAPETLIQTATWELGKNLTILGHPSGTSKIYAPTNFSYLGSAMQMVTWNVTALRLSGFTVEHATAGMRMVAINMLFGTHGFEVDHMTFKNITANVFQTHTTPTDPLVSRAAAISNVFIHHNIVDEWWESMFIFNNGYVDNIHIFNNYCVTNTANPAAPGSVSAPYGVSWDYEFDAWGSVTNSSCINNHFEITFAISDSLGISFSQSSDAKTPIRYDAVVANNTLIGWWRNFSVRLVNWGDALYPTKIVIVGNRHSSNPYGTPFTVWPVGGPVKGNPYDILVMANNEGPQPEYVDMSEATGLTVVDEQNNATVFRPWLQNMSVNMTSWWDFEELGTRLDNTPSNNDLEETDTVSRDSGQVGSGARFFGNFSLSCFENDGFRINGDFTVSFWVQFNRFEFEPYIFKGGSIGLGAAWDYIVYYDNGTFNPAHNGYLGFCVSADGSTHSATVDIAYAPTLDSWHLINAWYDSVADLLWLQIDNGTAVSAAYGGAINTSGAAFQVGASGWTSTGTVYLSRSRIDCLGVWKRVLTSGERTTLWNSGSGVSAVQIVPPGGQTDVAAASFSETWTHADSADIDADHRWRRRDGTTGGAIVSNAVQVAATPGTVGLIAQCQKELTSANHYAEADFSITAEHVDDFLGISVRHDLHNATAYYVFLEFGANQISVWKRFYIKYYQLGVTSATLNTSTVYKIRITVNGSSLSVALNGTTISALNIIDTAIPGGTFVGLYVGKAGTGTATVDNFAAATV